MSEKKVALITGAGRGIGRAIALTLAEKGFFVVVNYNGSAAKAQETVEIIRQSGGEAVSCACDVSDFNACGEMMAALIKDYGHIDVLVNNAGITRDNLLMKMSEEDFDKVIAVNLKGCFNTIKHLSRQLLKQRSGKIINISSVTGVMGNAGQANYCASKAGIIGLTKSSKERPDGADFVKKNRQGGGSGGGSRFSGVFCGRLYDRTGHIRGWRNGGVKRRER